MHFRCFGLSFCFHIAVIAALLWGGSLVTAPARSVLETVVEPNHDKLIWYNFRKQLPNLDAADATREVARGVTRSERVAIADTRRTHPSEFVWQPTAVELPKEVKAPNLISLQSPTPRKVFTPPAPAVPVAKAAPAVAPMTPAPVLDVTASKITLPAAMPLAQPVQRTSAVTAPLMLPAPSIQMETAQVALPSAPALAPAGSPAPGTQTVASINLEANATGPLPTGRRAGSFSTAPITGESAGARGGNASIPGLTTRGSGRNAGTAEAAMKPPVLAPPAEGTTVLYRDIMAHPMGSSLSAPLRVGSRIVPAGVEAKFRDRPIYTMVIPSPKLPEYAADWIVWFSERLAPEGAVSSIRAPLPDKKRVQAAAEVYAFGAEADVQITVLIDEAGRIQDAVVAKLPAGFPARFALADLKLWQFKPATRNGVPVAVEAILDIPFRRIVSGWKQ